MPPAHCEVPSDPNEWDLFVDGAPGSILLRAASADRASAELKLFTAPTQILAAQSVDEIPSVFSGIEAALRSGHPVAGFLAYEAGYHFEPAALGGSPASSASDLPCAWFGVYREPAVATVPVCDGDGSAPSQAPGDDSIALAISFDAYREKVLRIRRYIEEGDLYQANLTVALEFPWAGQRSGLFRRMMANQPVPYGAFLNLGATAILSASPELFFRRDGSELLVRPMKGTVRRGRDLEEDADLAAWLAADPKNRAENVMIVDLLRNDLGRVCSPGSVRVENLFSVERYDDLFQMTSTVRGSLRPGTSWYEVFRALFPCGSITGAPKVRTMQVIRALEGEPRGIACGAIGHFSPTDQAEFSVAIRTLSVRDGSACMRVGSGITYDSDPAAEYDECRLKARFISRAPLHFKLIETLLWEGHFPFLELHLERLGASAAYFGFRLDLDAVRQRLMEHANSFAAGEVSRVRLTLARSGDVSVESQPLERTAAPASLLLSRVRTDSQDRFLRHKTTHRAVYDLAHREARAGGFDDALFVNERGEVTECSIYNVLIEKDGIAITPPVECGVLPGVYRRHLLESRPEVRQERLTMADLLAADRILIFNSVRGMRAVGAVYEHPQEEPLWTQS